ncbi:alpha/beta fold hydrolase [Maricaulaceae bacterium MS644]
MTARRHSWGVRGAVRVKGRAVHYRRAGKPGAPVVILLHGSPESASALFAVAAALEGRFDVIGFDTPGNGLSDPLDVSDPYADDYARALFAFMDVMGVERAGLYGFHTGAGTAMSAALLAPERVAALALDGYAVWTPQERDDLLARYCVVHTPVWDGSHLARIWARLEEQLIFFPWNTPRLDARMDLAPTPIEVRLRRLRDWLTAWESYPAPYRAAFNRDGHVGPDRTGVPTLLGAQARDPLSTHLVRLSDLSGAVRVASWGEDRERALSEITAHLSAYPGAAAKTPELETKAGDAELLASLARPAVRPGWSPDDHGGFLLKLWRDLRLEAIAAAPGQAALDAALDPLTLHRRVTAAIQAETGL